MTATRRDGARGYTAVEVLFAITLFAIGAAGVIGMERATIRGNQDARRLDVGQALARQWVERLRRDATLWQVGGPQADRSRTRWLKDGDGHIATPPTWRLVPAPTTDPADGLSSRFDTLGRDLTSAATLASDPPLFYCAQMRLEWLVPDQLLRAEVRVFWPRNLELGPAGTFCQAGDTSPDDADAVRRYQFVHVTTTLRGTPL